MRAADTGNGDRWLREVAFTRDFLRNSIRAYEPHRLHFLTETFTELLIGHKAGKGGDVVVDAGANHGYHTRHLLDALGQGGHVHAFEPNPVLAAGLKAWVDPRLKFISLRSAPRLGLRRFTYPLMTTAGGG